MRRVLALLLFLPATLCALAQGSPAPAFSAKDLSGYTWTQKSPGKGLLLVDFWASWCVPCVGEIPALNTLEAKYATQGRLWVLGLNLDKGDAAAVQAIAARLKVRYAVAPGGQTTAEAYGVQGFPTAFLLRDGQILAVLTGRRSLSDFQRDLAPYLKQP